MSDSVVVTPVLATEVTPEGVAKVLGMMVRGAKVIVALTPTEVDDKVLGFVQPFLENPEVVELLVYLINLRNKNPQMTQAELLQAAASR